MCAVVSKGRTSSVVSIRLPDSLLSLVKARASKRGVSVADYIKAVLVKSVSSERR